MHLPDSPAARRGSRAWAGRDRPVRDACSAQRRGEPSAPLGGAGIVGTEDVQKVDVGLADLVVRLHRAQEFGQAAFDVVDRLGADQRRQVAGLGGLRDAGDQDECLVAVAGVIAFDQEGGEGDDGLRVVGLGLERRPQGGLVADRQQAFEFRRLLRRQEAGDEVAHEGLALCSREGVGGPSVDDGVDGGDGLGLEGLGDSGVLVNIHLGEDDPAPGLADDLLEDWPQLGAGPAPGCPEVDYDGHLCRAVEDLGLEGGVGDIHGFVSRFPRWHGGGFAVQGRETPRRLHYRSPP